MATKPTKLPRWGTSGAAITEPTEAKKDIGWVVQEKPPAQFMNWLDNLGYQWCAYLDDIENQTLTWTKLHTFQRSISVNAFAGTSNDAIACQGDGSGRGLSAVGGSASGTGVYAQGGTTNGIGLVAQGTGTAVGAQIAGGASGHGLLVSGGSNSDGVRSFGLGSGNGIFAQGGASGHGLNAIGSGSGFAVNATNSASNHAIFATRTNAPAGFTHTCRFDGYAGGIVNTAAALFVVQNYVAPTGWTRRTPAIVVGEGCIQFAGTVQPTVTQDPGFANVLCGKNVPKAWARVASRAGDTDVTRLKNGYNIASVSTSVNTVDVTFARTVNTEYIVNVTTMGGAPPQVPYTIAETIFGFTIRSTNLNAGFTNVSVQVATQFDVGFVVYGVQ